MHPTTPASQVAAAAMLAKMSAIPKGVGAKFGEWLTPGGLHSGRRLPEGSIRGECERQNTDPFENNEADSDTLQN